jgi:hypothetical protein
MCTVLLPPGDNPIAINKYIIRWHVFSISAAFIFLFSFILKFSEHFSMLLTDFALYFKRLRGRISNLIIKTKKRHIALTSGSSLKILCEILKSVLSQKLRDKVSSDRRMSAFTLQLVSCFGTKWEIVINGLAKMHTHLSRSSSFQSYFAWWSHGDINSHDRHQPIAVSA